MHAEVDDVKYTLDSEKDLVVLGTCTHTIDEERKWSFTEFGDARTSTIYLAVAESLTARGFDHRQWEVRFASRTALLRPLPPHDSVRYVSEFLVRISKSRGAVAVFDGVKAVRDYEREVTVLTRPDADWNF